MLGINGRWRCKIRSSLLFYNKTVHVTEHTDLEKIEKDIIAEDFSDSQILLEDVNRFKDLLDFINKNK